MPVEPDEAYFETHPISLLDRGSMFVCRMWTSAMQATPTDGLSMNARREIGAIVAREKSQIASAACSIDHQTVAEAELNHAASNFPNCLTDGTLATALKFSIAVRSAKCRHSPAIQGVPAAQHPDQRRPYAFFTNNQINTHYVRDAFFVMSRDGMGHFGFADEQAAHAKYVAQVVYGKASYKGKHLLFPGEMAALTCFYTWAFAKYGRDVAFRRHCWLESQYAFDADKNELFDDIRLDGTGNWHTRRIVHVDCLPNHPQMPVVDLPRLAGRLGGRRFARGTTPGRFLVIDAAGCPGFDGSTLLSARLKGLCVVVVISGVKFLQAGLDLQRGGLLSLYYDPDAFGEADDPYQALIMRRGNLGLALGVEEVAANCIDTRATFLSRMKRIDENTCRFARSIDDLMQKHACGRISSAWLDNSRRDLALKLYGTAGRVFYLLFDHARFPDSQKMPWLQHFCRNLCNNAGERRVPLSEASTFGLASPSIHIVTGLPEGLYLRVSPGSALKDHVNQILASFDATLSDLASSINPLRSRNSKK
jgi:hypothetical protein